MRSRHYLDHNATTFLRPQAAAALSAALALAGNPSSVHAAGRAARQWVETGRTQIARLVGADPANVVLTSGGTEANDLALNGTLKGMLNSTGAARVLVSAVEHESVTRARADAEIIPVDRQGRVDLAALDALLASNGAGALVAVMLANNETGVIQPLTQVVDMARRHGARVHCDAVQAAGKIAIDLADLGVDTLSLSAHKLGGPMGIGALVLGDGVEVQSRIRGGGQERGRRAGTENVPAIAGFGAAAAAAMESLEEFGRLRGLRDDLEARLLALSPASSVFGSGAPRLPNTTCVSLPGVSSETQVMALDLDGVAVSAGSACSSGKVVVSRVLDAMGVGPMDAGSAIRVSLGWNTTEEDVNAFLEAWGALAARLGPNEKTTAPAA